MTSTAETPRRRGRPPTLSRVSILRAADTIPLDEMTMPRLAEALGVTDRAIYYWFPSREDLLRALAADLLAALTPPSAEGKSWQGWLVELGEQMRQFLIDNPVVVRNSNAAISAGIRLLDMTIDLLTRAGLSVRTALDAHNLVVGYAVHAASRELDALTLDPEQTERIERSLRDPDLAPHLVPVADQLTPDRDAEYRRNLQRIVAAFALELP